MPAIMSLEEPRPRGTVLGERADRLRVRESENFFRCNICGGYLDARDYVWIEDHEGPLPHPTCDQLRWSMRDRAERHRPCWARDIARVSAFGPHVGASLGDELQAPR